MAFCMFTRGYHKWWIFQPWMTGAYGFVIWQPEIQWLPWMPVASHGEMGGIRPEILVKYEGNGWKLNSGLTLALW